jgi:hypothetical protein
MKAFLEALKVADKPVRVWIGGSVHVVKIDSVSDDRVTLAEGATKFTMHPNTVVVEHS